MIRNRFDGFDNELDLVELSKRISNESPAGTPFFRPGTFAAGAELQSMAEVNLADLAAQINNQTGGAAGPSQFVSVLPTSLSESFFIDRGMFVSPNADGWVEAPVSGQPTEAVTPTYNRIRNSGSATGESSYLELLSDLLGGLSEDQMSLVRSMQVNQSDKNRVFYSDGFKGVSDEYVDGSQSFVGDSDFDYHGSSCPCCGPGATTSSSRPQGLGNGGDGDGDQNDFAPTVSAIDRTLEIGTFRNITHFFDYYDYDGNPMTAIRVIDKGEPNESGYWFYNGARVQANQWIEVPVEHLDRLRFFAGEVEYNEAIGIMVSDGKFWSTADFARVITAPENLLRPTAQGFAGTVLSGESVKFQDYIQANDPEDNLLKMRIIDRIDNPNSGYFAVNGVARTQGQWFEITVDQLANVDYHGARNEQAEFVAFQVFDGKFWSNVANFKMSTTPNLYRPSVQTVDVELDTGDVIQVGKWLTFTDADGSTAKRFRFFDTGARADGGYFTLDGVRQTAQAWFEVKATDMHLLRYHASDSADFEKFRVMAYDSRYWSDIATGSVTVRVSPTADMPDILVLSELETVDLSSVLSVNGNGVSLKKVYVYEPLSEGNGTLAYQGSRLDTGVVHEFTWAEFNDLQYVAGAADAGRHLDDFLIKFDNGLASTPWERINVVTEVVGANALFTGTSWSSSPETPAVVTYSFPLTVPGYYPDDADERTDLFTPLNATQRARVRHALDLYSSFANIEFVEVSDAVGGVMRFAITDLPDGVYGWAYLPDPSKPTNTTHGDVWIDDLFINDPFLDGTEGWLTLIHEIGHAVGLGHPFTPPGQTGPQLPPDTNNHFFSQMSYTRTGQVAGVFSVDGPYGPQGTDFPYGIDTPMLYDMVAVQGLYGSNPTQNEDDTVYNWSTFSPFRETIRDTAGIDTINASNYNTDQTIDLRAGHFSSIGLQDWTVMLSHDTVIENAIGGAGDDMLYGNEANNLLFGNDARDTLEGGGGVDFMSGGAGNDTYVWRLGDGWDVIDENKGAGRDVLNLYGSHSAENLPYGTMNELENDFIFRRLGRDLRIDFTIDRGLAVGGVTIKDYAWGGSRVESLQIFGASGAAVTPKISLYSIFQQATDVATRFRVTDTPSPLGFIAAPVV